MHPYVRNAAVTATVVALGGCLSGPPGRTADSGPTLVERIEMLETKVGTQQRALESGQMLELMNRVEVLHAEVRELRGMVETLGHEAESLSRRQRELYLDLDRRLQNLEGGAARLATQVPERPSQSAAPAQYDDAFKLLQEGRYPAAIDAFKSYLAANPQGPLADNAQYWLGEAYYVTRDYRTALVQFQGVVERFPDSRKFPDALLKIGYVHYELEQWDDARRVLTSVIERAPGTTIARLAEQRLQRMRQEGR